MKTIKTVVLLFFIILSQNLMAQCWTQIATGSYHILALKSDGTLWSWGLNDKGQLGDGTTVNKNVPTQIGTDTDWTIIDAEDSNSMALKTNGTLWMWGNNESGQLGNGSFGTGNFSNTPIQISSDTDWVKISTGGLRTFALKTNGTLWGWGENLYGHLGTGNVTPHYTPFQIGNATDWTDISTSGNHTLALKTNNTLWGWGLNKEGALAIGIPDVGPIITMPTQTGNNTSDWLKICAGNCCSSKMIKTDGSIWAMGGIGSYGNVGNGGITGVNTPTRIGIDNDWSTVSTGNHTCAIKNNGTLWSWGFNFQGQLGDGSNTNRTVPTQAGPTNTWLTVKTGLNHTVALSSNHTIYAWGWNNYGQLGDGTFEDKNTPYQIGNSCPLSTSEFNLNEALHVLS
ncbi:MAG: hypothetical protein IPP30_07320 [Flavobacterium sp.]|nr:hypothetical protein [Flavobacterium sp.]